MANFLNPEEVLNQLKIRDDMLVADFGCGSGGWVIPLARRIKNGRVYAIDILEEPLSVLKSRATSEEIGNIEAIKADLEDDQLLKLANDFLDLVLLTNLLFQVEDKKSILEKAKRVLKNGGQVLVVDWKPGALLGPKENQISSQEITKIAKQAGLKIEKEFEVSPFHWGLILRK